ncbi:hypothetical protein J4526_04870 [Desulfurococcaceae archaeon MEX13E-LK6-19]|nr:hypothetical protein J4526_04870 [Desulfurococcaceae archaeon MEX13E-LK6-19]
MIKKSVICSLLSLLIVVAIVFTPLVSAETIRGIRKIHVGALAVTKEGEGDIIEFNLWVTPGKGRLILLGNKGLLAEDVVASLNFSTWMAARIAGVYHDNYDYYVEYTDTSSVEGLSATLLFTLAFLVLLRGDPWDENATATGLIAPSGIVGNVSGIDEKYDAAVKYGYKRILTPVYPKLLGKAHYKPVVSIIDSYEVFALTPLYPKYDPALEKLLLNKSSVLNGMFYSSWRYFYNKSIEILDYIDDNIGIIHGLDLDKYYKSGYISINESKDYVEKGLYYTAASRAFYGYWVLNTVYIYIKCVNENIDPSMFIKDYEEILNEFNNTLTSYVKDVDNISLYDLDVLINVYERLFDSIESYNLSKGILARGIRNENDLIYFASNISYAIARIDTARQWMELTKRGSDVITIRTEALEKTIKNEYGLLRAFALFLKSLGFTDVCEYVQDLLSRKWFWSNNIVLLSRIIWIERDLSNFLLSVPQYTVLSSLVREGIRTSVVRMLEYFDLYSGEIMPSAYTALEFYSTSEEYGVAPLSTSMLHMLVLHEITSMKEQIILEPAQYTLPWLYVDKIVLFSMILIILGSFIIGYAIGIYGRKSIE